MDCFFNRRKDMDSTFHKIDTENWARKEEYNNFNNSGCQFTLTADCNITHLYEFVHSKNIKLYPVMVALVAQVINEHIEFKYGKVGNDFGYYDVIHPMFFDRTESGNVRALVAEYKGNMYEQIEEIEKVRQEYKDIDAYKPQGNKIPENNVNISCIPWVKFSSMAFSLQYGTWYYPPIVTFGKYEKKDGKVIIPLSVNCNHAVNDGYHASMLIYEFQNKAHNI